MNTEFLTLHQKAELMRESSIKSTEILITEISRLESIIRDYELGFKLISDKFNSKHWKNTIKMKVIETLPLEVGKTYKIKMAVENTFTISKITNVLLKNKQTGESKEKVHTIWGFYSDSPDLLNCPIQPERLINEKIIINTTTMEMNDFIKESKNDVLRFEKYWNENHKTQPEYFPLNMEPADWFEQFLIFLQNQVKED